MPVLPRIQPSPASGGRAAAPEDFGAGVAQARGQLGGAVQEIGSATQAILHADQGARVARATAQASIQLDQLQQDLSEDPSFETHAATYEKRRTEILQQTEKGAGLLPGRYSNEFRDRMVVTTARIGAQVRAAAREKQIDFARANLDSAGLDLSNQTASAKTLSEADDYREQFRTGIQEGVRSGLLTAQDAINRLQKFDRDVSLAATRRAIRTDPAAAFRQLQDPTDPITKGFSPAEREQMVTQAADEYSQQLREARENARFADEQRRRAEKERGEAAAKAADDHLAAGDLSGVQDVLRQNRDQMSESDYRYFTDKLAGGGRTPKTDPGTYLDLTNRASRGDPSTVDLANLAYRADHLTREDFDRIKKQSEDRRFGDVEDFINKSTRQSEFLGEFDEDKQIRAAETLRQFHDWTAKNPTADATAAQVRGRQALRDHGFKLQANNLRLTDPPQLDIPAARKDALDRHRRGELSEAAFTDEMERLQELQLALQLQEAPK